MGKKGEGAKKTGPKASSSKVTPSSAVPLTAAAENGRPRGVSAAGMHPFSKADNDLYSWIMFNHDSLLPNPSSFLGAGAHGHGGYDMPSHNIPDRLMSFSPSLDNENPVYALDPLLDGDSSSGIIPRDSAFAKIHATSNASDTSSLSNDKAALRRRGSAESLAISEGFTEGESGTGSGKDKKKEERLMRNREIARNCRKRKREKFEALEAEVNKLKERNRQLEVKMIQIQKIRVKALEANQAQSSQSVGVAQIPVVEKKELIEADVVEEDVRTAGLRDIDRALSEYYRLRQMRKTVFEAGNNEDFVCCNVMSKEERLEDGENGQVLPLPQNNGQIKGHSDGKIPVPVDELLKKKEKELLQKLNLAKDLISDFGKEKENEITFHMKQLELLLIPNQLSKMTLWSLQQEDDFYDENANAKKFGGGLWNTLCQEMGLSRAQKLELMNMRHGIKQQRNNIGDCLRILQELKQRVKMNYDHLKSQMSQIRSIINPIQQAKFLRWIAENQSAMWMLNNIWQHETEQATAPSTSAKSDSSSQDGKDDEGTDDMADTENNVPLPSEMDVKLTTQEMEEALKVGKTTEAMKQLIEGSEEFNASE